MSAAIVSPATRRAKPRAVARSVKPLFPALIHHVVREAGLRLEGFSFATRAGRELVLNVTDGGRYLGTVRLAMPAVRR